MDTDFWPYGMPANVLTLETPLDQHHARGLSARRVRLDEVFHSSTLEAFKI